MVTEVVRVVAMTGNLEHLGLVSMFCVLFLFVIAVMEKKSQKKLPKGGRARYLSFFVRACAAYNVSIRPDRTYHANVCDSYRKTRFYWLIIRNIPGHARLQDSLATFHRPRSYSTTVRS
jgi:hypothetical protein